MNKKLAGIVFLFLAQLLYFFDAEKLSFISQNIQNSQSSNNENSYLLNKSYLGTNKNNLKSISCVRTHYFFENEWREIEEVKKTNMIDIIDEDWRGHYYTNLVFNIKNGELYMYDYFLESYIPIPRFQHPKNPSLILNSDIKSVVVNGKLKYKYGLYHSWSKTIDLKTLKGIDAFYDTDRGINTYTHRLSCKFQKIVKPLN